MISEIARTVLSEYETTLQALRSNVNTIGEYQRAVFFRQIETEQQYKNGFVSDRAHDNLAYAADHTNELWSLMNTLEYRSYVEKLRTNVSTIFFIRPHKSLMTNDGIRESVHWDSINKIDGMIKFLLECGNIPYISIYSPLQQERTKTIDYILTAKEK